MNKISEKQLQEWERAPLQHRDEIVRTEQQFTDEFMAAMKAGNRYYQIYKAGSPEWMKEAQKDHQFTLVRNRLIKLVTVITRHDTEVSRMEFRQWRDARQQPVRKPILRCHPIAAKYIESAERYEARHYLKQFLVMGQA